MIKLNITEPERKKGKNGRTFFTLKNIMAKNLSAEFTKGAIIHQKNSKITFEIISINIFDNIKEAIEKTGYNKFKSGDSFEDVLDYYYKIGNNQNNSKWKTVVLELKKINIRKKE